MKFTLTRKQWERIGQTAGWEPTDLSDRSDRNIPPIYDPQTEENFLLGPEDKMAEQERIDACELEGFDDGQRDSRRGRFDESRNPYRTDTESGRKRFDAWSKGYQRSKSGVTAKTQNKSIKKAHHEAEYPEHVLNMTVMQLLDNLENSGDAQKRELYHKIEACLDTMSGRFSDGGEGKNTTANSKKTLVAQSDPSAQKRQNLVEASSLLGQAGKIMHLNGETDLCAECMQLNNRLLDRLPRK